MVHMVWERDSLSRRIYMTDQHSEHVKPSWFGELIGRYENGELVVDTIGLSTKLSFLDMFRTPHTEKLHVTERFKLTADGKFLEALVKVEDPDTFNEPMYMTTRWRKQRGPLAGVHLLREQRRPLRAQSVPAPGSEAAGFLSAGAFILSQ